MKSFKLPENAKFVVFGPMQPVLAHKAIKEEPIPFRCLYPCRLCPVPNPNLS